MDKLLRLLVREKIPYELGVGSIEVYFKDLSSHNAWLLGMIMGQTGLKYSDLGVYPENRTVTILF